MKIHNVIFNAAVMSVALIGLAFAALRYRDWSDEGAATAAAAVSLDAAEVSGSCCGGTDRAASMLAATSSCCAGETLVAATCAEKSDCGSDCSSCPAQVCESKSECCQSQAKLVASTEGAPSCCQKSESVEFVGLVSAKGAGEASSSCCAAAKAVAASPAVRPRRVPPADAKARLAPANRVWQPPAMNSSAASDWPTAAMVVGQLVSMPVCLTAATDSRLPYSFWQAAFLLRRRRSAPRRAEPL
jgi:Tfp pilus assembly protein FimV